MTAVRREVRSVMAVRREVCSMIVVRIKVWSVMAVRRVVSDGCKKGGLVSPCESSVTRWERVSNVESSVSLSM